LIEAFGVWILERKSLHQIIVSRDFRRAHEVKALDIVNNSKNKLASFCIA